MKTKIGYLLITLAIAAGLAGIWDKPRWNQWVATAILLGITGSGVKA